MDFFTITQKETGPFSNRVVVLEPVWQHVRIKDLMIRSGKFYAVWDEENQIWSEHIHRLVEIVDAELLKAAERENEKNPGGNLRISLLKDDASRGLNKFIAYCKDHGDGDWKPLNHKIAFADTPLKRSDYVSRRLPYKLDDGDFPAWDEIMGTLFDPPERAKLEWTLGCIFAGNSHRLDKFVVLYGEGGSGKSTFLKLVQKLLPDYCGSFSMKELLDRSTQFQTAAFSKGELVMIDDEADMSRFDGDTGNLKKIVSHEPLLMNIKGVPQFEMRTPSVLFAATNKDIDIHDSQDGIVRRLIDVTPSRRRFSIDRYYELMGLVDFELGAVASHCLQVYETLGKEYYRGYKPEAMISQTNAVYNFVADNFEYFTEGTTFVGSTEFRRFKEYKEQYDIRRHVDYSEFRKELKLYFEQYSARAKVGDSFKRHVYTNFRAPAFMGMETDILVEDEGSKDWLELAEQVSLIDISMASRPAQYAIQREGSWGGEMPWAKNKKTLGDLDTSKPHWVQYPIDHIVIDFDLKGPDSEKSLERNLEAASAWPATYVETSQGGQGLHLHYKYAGGADAAELAAHMPDDKDIEIKVCRGDASDRRRVYLCNDTPVATLPVGSLPVKEKRSKVYDKDQVETEKSLRATVEKALRREVHPNTSSNVDFIAKIMNDAYDQGVVYDLSDLRGVVQSFAARSSHQALRCLKVVNKIHWKSETPPEEVEDIIPYLDEDTDPLVFFDIEVYPNLLLVCWKAAGEDKKVVRMFNPSAAELEELFNRKLVGFNIRHYDNHILMGRYMGDTLEECYARSRRIIEDKDQDAKIGSAYSLSYTDVKDFCSQPLKGLKEWEIDLGIKHQEFETDWTKPLPEDQWEAAAKYCENDVIAAEQVFNHCHEDFLAREILAELSGLTVNDTTRKHVVRILFGRDKKPSDKFKYTDLSEMFEGYSFDQFVKSEELDEDGETVKKVVGQSTYRGEVVGEGGYVYSEPGVHFDVALIDVASMHPTSLEQLDLFGPYTKNFSDLKAARIAIKHKDFDTAGKMLDGKLKPYLGTEEKAQELATALKLVINKVYGYTSATFDNEFLDKRNRDNIVAKRGALFMIDLKHAVQEQGFTVAHIKTDSIKIPDATPEIIKFVMDFGKKYGYDFEHEATYEKMWLVDKAQYIAKYGWTPNGKKVGEWTATGKMFLRPYVLKTLFTKEPIKPKDLAVVFKVQTSLWLDFNEGQGEDFHDRHHIGRVGKFYPVAPGCGGAELLRQDKLDAEKFNYASGAKGQRWLEAEQVESLGNFSIVDRSYHEQFADEVLKAYPEETAKSTPFNVFNDELPF